MVIYMIFPSNIFILLIVCAILCCIGFKKFIWFISIGYGAAIAGAGITLFILYHKSIPVVILLQCLLFVFYGVRLGGFLLLRELKSVSYRKSILQDDRSKKKFSPVLSFITWLTVSFLYVAEISPVFYRLDNDKSADIFSYIGLIIMVLALVIESSSDAHKSRVKAKNPNRYCDTGLFKLVRCPNYFGEVLFWTGVFISGITAYSSIYQWIIPVVGYISIVYIMLSGAKRLELRQDKNYGANKEFKKYSESTPLIIPFIPLYSLKKCNWIKI